MGRDGLSIRRYSISYTYRPPGQSGVEASAAVILDLSGNLIPGIEMPDIPDCTPDPQQCVFIDKAAAFGAAREAGMQPEVDESHAVFQWYGGENQFPIGRQIELPATAA